MNRGKSELGDLSRKHVSEPLIGTLGHSMCVVKGPTNVKLIFHYGDVNPDLLLKSQTTNPLVPFELSKIFYQLRKMLFILLEKFHTQPAAEEVTRTIVYQF